VFIVLLSKWLIIYQSLCIIVYHFLYCNADMFDMCVLNDHLLTYLLIVTGCRRRDYPGWVLPRRGKVRRQTQKVGIEWFQRQRRRTDWPVAQRPGCSIPHKSGNLADGSSRTRCVSDGGQVVVGAG